MKAILMISGGFDSAVAAKIMKDKGFELKAVHFSYEPFTDNKPELKSKKVCEILGIPFKVINIAKELEIISNNTKPEYYFVLTKRLMHKLAEEEAKKENCKFIVNGENLGQVSSQTLENLRVIDEATSIPIIRPLLCFDKEEIIKRSRAYGFYDICIGPEVCDVLGPRNPKTRAKLDKVLIEEQRCKFT